MNTIFDFHQDIAFNALMCTKKDFWRKNTLKKSCYLENQLNQSDYVRLLEGGIKVVSGVVFPLEYDGKHMMNEYDACYNNAINQLEYYNNLAYRYPNKIRILRTYADLDTVMNTKDMLGIHILLEDATCINADMSTFDAFYSAGVRTIGPVWNLDNQYGGGCDSDNELTNNGKILLQEMSKRGMMLDTAHMNPMLFSDCISFYEGTIINSHTCCRALQEHRRNLYDSQIIDIARKNGVIGIAAVPSFLNSGGATSTDYHRHIEHIRALVGDEYVGFGTDFDGMSYPNYPSDMPDITCMKDISKRYNNSICYKNWHRVLSKTLSYSSK